MLRSFLTRSSAALRTVNVRCASDSASKFAAAQADLKKLKEEPDNDVKLKLYALFKQSTAGDVAGDQPSRLKFVERAKYDAWANVKGLSNEQAQQKYAELVSELRGQEASEAAESGSPVPEGGIEGVKITVENKVMTILLNRPKKFNALNLDMYGGITKLLNESNDNRDIHMIVLTGAGEYFSAGNDLSNFTMAAKYGKEKAAEMFGKVYVDFILSIIKCNKPLVALVNGPAVGIAFTALPLFNYVLASDKATFSAPFATLGQVAEGGSTFTFPYIMGWAKACEILMFGRKLTATEAYERNLINEVIPAASFQEEALKRVAALAKLPPVTMNLNATNFRDVNREKLIQVATHEAKVLQECWVGKECEQAITQFMTRKK